MNTAFHSKSLHLKNRVLVASGTFGYGNEVARFTDLSKIGGIVTKSVSWKPRIGNAPMRIAETPSGMLNSIGLANVGIEEFTAEKLPYLRNVDSQIIVNIAASTIDEYIQILERLEDEEGIAAYEINVSCPNVKEGGLNFGTRCEMTGEITRELRKRTDRFLIIKLTPNVTHIADFAKTCQDEGADSVSLINTLVGMAVNIKTRRPVLSTITGGFSGPAIKPVALAKVYEAAKAVKIPIIGIGGIMSWKDAIEFLLVGASAIQVGTANFLDPDAAAKIAEGMAAYCEEEGIEDIQELVGALKVHETQSAPGFVPVKA
ncbi:MAG: dihydroorotate dehydrogenase B catalytic subunit [Ectothiorhodospiraceae bacterium]|nr:dihydroorotate dehydrogenase B catalytic subunit [Ectothiorhodospiraceae bacterium]